MRWVGAALIAAVLALPAAAYLRDLEHINHGQGWHPEDPDSCAVHAIRMCPFDDGHLHTSSHLACVERRLKELPAHCRAWVVGAGWCQGDMERLCDDMEVADTFACLYHHRAELSEMCHMSPLMLDLLETTDGVRPEGFREKLDKFNELTAHLNDDL